MLTLGVDYLCGWAAATSVASWSEPEWPPHPDRIFMALAAAHFETAADPAERTVLEWLEAAAPPWLACSRDVSLSGVTTFVPVNDVSAPRVKSTGVISKGQLDAGVAVLPERRDKKARTFRRAIPRNPVVFLVWPDLEIGLHSVALERLCRKVTHIGHSSSFVQMWVSDTSPDASLRPTETSATERLRVPSAGRLRELERLFTLDPPQRPRPGVWQGYAPPRYGQDVDAPRSLFSPELIVLRLPVGTLLGLESTLVFTQALRRSMLAYASEPIPEWISGHRPDGSASDTVHVAWLPLADVGHRYADGHVMGVALAIPEHVGRAEAARALGALWKLAALGTLHVFDGPALDVCLTLEDAENPPVALRPSTWTASIPSTASDCWATVTPIVLPRYPKKAGDAESLVALSCAHAGLPTPSAVVVTGASRIVGAPHARQFPPLLAGARGASGYHTHAVIQFNIPIVGPVLLGSGRYRGYGVCRPWRGDDR